MLVLNRSVSAMIGTPSIRPVQGFNANADAEVLRKAMKGLGCNNSKVFLRDSFNNSCFFR